LYKTKRDTVTKPSTVSGKRTAPNSKEGPPPSSLSNRYNQYCIIMGINGSKAFVNQMLRSSVCGDDNGNDLFGDNLEDHAFRQMKENQDEEEEANKAHMLLSMAVHHWNVGRMKRREVLQGLLQNQRRRREQRRWLLQQQQLRKKRNRRPKYFVDPVSGLQRPLSPKLSFWWITYVLDPKPECRSWSKTFRNRFRMPYHSFIGLLHLIREDGNADYFRRWNLDTSSSAISRRVSPIELLLLGSLRYLGRGWTFDDLEEATHISRDVHRCFFHEFCRFGAQKLYPKYVQQPRTLLDLNACEKEYREAGFPGCIGSSDATHIPLERVSYRIRQSHLGYKMSSTARTYNLTVNHRRQILHSTTGHPGRWNDKTLVRFDSFMNDLQNGVFNKDLSFELKLQRPTVDGSVEDGNGQQEQQEQATTVATRTIHGAYVIVDNGYLDWSTTVPPIKKSNSRAEIRFSQWLESLRKDVECAFGILKGRWRVLKTGIRVHNTEAADNMWLTCCALHNMLLDVDGLSAGWQNGVPSHWELAGGNFDQNDIPESIRRLLSPDAIRTYDQSTCGYSCQQSNGNNSSETSDILADERGNCFALAPNAQVAVNDISLCHFRAMLVENLNVLFHEKKVVWPKRLATKSISRPRLVPTTMSPL
jgi:hypothetical protein